MVCDRVHLLELSHVNITEATSFGSWSRDSSACSSLEALILFLLLCLSFFLGAHLFLDSGSIVPYAFHQLLALLRHVGLVVELELIGWWDVCTGQTLTWAAWSILQTGKRGITRGRNVSETKLHARVGSFCSCLMYGGRMHLVVCWFRFSLGSGDLGQFFETLFQVSVCIRCRYDMIDGRVLSNIWGFISLDDRVKSMSTGSFTCRLRRSS